MQNFIPSYHLVFGPGQKNTADWCMQAVNYCYFNNRNYNLLCDKNIVDIEGFANGTFSLDFAKKIFKSEAKKLREVQRNNPNFLDTDTAIGAEFTRIDLLSEKLHSAIEIIDKIPVEVSCVASDPLAVEKKQSDVNFLKNKPAVEEELQVVADRMNLGKVDLGSTKNSSVEFSDSPFGLDLTNPEELDIFVNLIYSLKVETSFETILQYFYKLKNILNIKLLEIKDQFKYAVSVHEAFQNDLTGLPDAAYVYPGDMEVPYSRLPDFSDNSHRIRYASLTPLQLFDRFGSEIGSEDDLYYIINASKTDGGYCACNGGMANSIPYSNFDTYKCQLKYIEVKTVDWIGVKKVNKKSKYKTFTDDPAQATEKIWVQNTIGFWWLVNTKRVYGIHKLPFSKRTKGKESYQNFSTNIYKSDEKSAVENSIGECKKAQIADIKLQHTIIKSKPDGVYIDLKYLRGALEGLKDESDTWNMNRLLTLAIEQNVVLGDTEGFDGKNEGQFKAVQDLPGGLRASIVGYMNVIAAANINISRITGINQQLTGQSANEEGLVGVQKLLINAGINALKYVNNAIEFQYESLLSIWANIIQQAVEEGGKTKEAIKNVIGAKKVNIIDGLDDIALHDIGIFVSIKQREEERQLFKNKLTALELAGVLTASDSFMVNNITNPKDQWAFIAVKEQQYRKREDVIRQQNYENAQNMVKMQGENTIAAKNADTEGKLKNTYAKGEVEAQVTTLAGQLGLSKLQMEGLIKKDLQRERNKGNVDKTIVGVEAKSNAKQQEAMV